MLYIYILFTPLPAHFVDILLYSVQDFFILITTIHLRKLGEVLTIPLKNKTKQNRLHNSMNFLEKRN